MRTFEARYKLESEAHTGIVFFKHVHALNAEEARRKVQGSVDAGDQAFDICIQEVPAFKQAERTAVQVA